jgi:hypothetical protein
MPDETEKAKIVDFLYHVIAIKNDFSSINELDSNDYLSFVWHKVFRGSQADFGYVINDNGFLYCTTETIEKITKAAFGKPFTNHAASSSPLLKYANGVYVFMGADGDPRQDAEISDIQIEGDTYIVKFDIISTYDNDERTFICKAEAVIKKSDDIMFGYNIVSLKRNLPTPTFTSVKASSVLAPQASISYNAENIIDGKNETAWVEGAQGNGIGEWIMISSNSPQKVSGLYIVNGYAKSDESYMKNNRPARIKIEFSDGSILEEILDDNGFSAGQIITFDREITTTYVKITILDIYKGTADNDTCISEINMF